MKSVFQTTVIEMLTYTGSVPYICDLLNGLCFNIFTEFKCQLMGVLAVAIVFLLL